MADKVITQDVTPPMCTAFMIEDNRTKEIYAIVKTEFAAWCLIENIYINGRKVAVQVPEAMFTLNE